MKKMLHYLFMTLIITSCGDTPDNNGENPEVSEEDLSMEELIRKKITAELDILATENYTVDIHKKHLNDDEFEDAVVLVNRKEYAIQKSKEANRTTADAKLGYFGNNNIMFYYDGFSNEVTRPIAVPSSVVVPLKLEFHNIQTAAYYDFTLDTRVQETRWRNFYTVVRGVPKLVFQWNIQNLDENDVLTTNHIEFDKGSYSLAKDILIYEAELLNDLPEDLMTDYELNTKPKGEIAYRFFYNPKEGKYFTNK